MADATTAKTTELIENSKAAETDGLSDAESVADTDNRHLKNLYTTTQDFYQLIAVFINEVRKVLPCDGIEFNEDNTGLHFIDGVISQNRCNYEIKFGEELLGKICFSREKAFLNSEMATLDTMVAGLVLPLRNSLHYQQAVRYALRDNLTGLRNGNFYFDNIGLEIERARRYKTPFSLLLLNLDNFRELNEQYGHSSGNTIVVEVAGRLEHEARNSDIVFRIGGDEFLVFLPNTARAGAVKVAERLKDSIMSTISIDKRTDIQLTVSIGVVTVLANDTAFKLIDRADKALFHAKILGKNRIQTETDPAYVLTGRP